jgi:tetratricopeptide (TPR) repeat protein
MSASGILRGLAFAGALALAPLAKAVTSAPAIAACPQGNSPPVAEARAALDREPDALEPLLALETALTAQGCYGAAVQLLEAAEAEHGRNTEFQARLRTARSFVSEQQYIEGLGRAEEAARAQRNRLRCAQLSDLEACEEALKARPNDAEILIAKGDALSKANRPAEAAASYRRAVELDPANRALAGKIAAAQQQRSRLVLECSSGSGAAAVAACDAALVRGATDEFVIQRRKGMLLQVMGESSQALDAYIAADSLRSGDRSVALAIVSLTESPERRDAIGLAARGSALLTLGRGSDAVAALRQAQVLAPSVPDLRRKLAAAERLAQTEPQRPAAPVTTVAAVPTRPVQEAPPPPARRYSNDAPTTRSH